MVKDLGPGVAEQLLNSSPKLRTVDGKLVSTEEAGLSEHDPLTGEARSSRSVPTLNLQETWPGAGRLFYGDGAIYWAELGSRETELQIMRLPPDGPAEQLLTVSKGAAVSSVVIDQSAGLVVIGLAGPSPPWGFGIKKIVLYQTQSGLMETLEIEGHIPLGELEAGGGLQVLVTP